MDYDRKLATGVGCCCNKYLKIYASLKLGDRGWKTFDVHARKSLYCCEWTFQRDSGESSERKEESCQEKSFLLREYLSDQEQNFSRNMADKGHSDAVSDRNEEYGVGTRRKDHPSHKVAKDLAELFSCSSVLWKV